MRIPTTPNVQHPPDISSRPASEADCSLAGIRTVDCPLRLRADDAFSSYREDDSIWIDCWRVQQSCPVSLCIENQNDDCPALSVGSHLLYDVLGVPPYPAWLKWPYVSSGLVCSTSTRAFHFSRPLFLVSLMDLMRLSQQTTQPATFPPIQPQLTSAHGPS